MAAPFAAISRNPATKEGTLHVAGSGAWRFFAHDSSGGELLLEAAHPGVFPLPEASPRWTRFELETPEGRIPVAERQLPMAGGYNFRDIGGFAGVDGKHVAWGKLFRTDDMASLTKADCAYLASIPLVTVVDFRTETEKADAPDKFPESVVNALHYPIAPGFLNPEGSTKQYADSDDFMLGIYHDLVLDEGITATYRRFFNHVQNAANLPLSFHCAAGKDRTGFAAALVLFSLGVDKEAILADYEASNAYLGDKYAAIIATYPDQSGLYIVKPAFLMEALSLIDAKYGSMERYLTQALDIDIAAMRALFLC